MSAPVRVGQIIADKYAIERVLGEGGMGVVVAAKHLALEERVAIKFLAAHQRSKPGAVARFLREGRAAVRIRNEHVARVLDVGTLPAGEPYLVMEYLAGRDLGATLKASGPLAVDVAVDYVLQAAEAIAVAHSRGVIHRDLKPANLFVTRGADGSPVLKVIDFGISKHRGSGLGEGDSSVTDSDVVMGSPLYMPPEQMRSARDVDVRGDIWALGAILHCLITGSPPFPGASIPEIYDGILAGPPSLASSLPDAPIGLEAAIARCLRKDVSQRYSSVAELAAAIAPFGPPHAIARAERVARILETKWTLDEPEPPIAEAEDARRPAEDTARPAASAGGTEAPRTGSWSGSTGVEAIAGSVSSTENTEENSRTESPVTLGPPDGTPAAPAPVVAPPGPEVREKAAGKRLPALAILAASGAGALVALALRWGPATSPQAATGDTTAAIPHASAPSVVPAPASPSSASPGASTTPPQASESASPGASATALPSASASVSLASASASPSASASASPSASASAQAPSTSVPQRSGAKPIGTASSALPGRPVATAQPTSKKWRDPMADPD